MDIKESTIKEPIQQLSLNQIIEDLNKQGLSVGNIFIIDDVIKVIEINYKIFIIYIYFSSSVYNIINIKNKSRSLTLSLIKPSKKKNITNPKETIILHILDFVRNIKLNNNYILFNNINTIFVRDEDIIVYKNGYISPNDKDLINIYPLIEYDDLKNNLKNNNWDEIKSFHNLIFSNIINNYNNKILSSKLKILKKSIELMYKLENKEIKSKDDLNLFHSHRKKIIQQASNICFEIDQLNYYYVLYNFFNNK